MQQLTFDLTTLTPKTTRKPDPEFERKRLVEREMLPIINSGSHKWSSIGFRGRMWDAGYRTAENWEGLLSEMKQSKNPGATWGYKMKRK